MGQCDIKFKFWGANYNGTVGQPGEGKKNTESRVLRGRLIMYPDLLSLWHETSTEMDLIQRSLPTTARRRQ